MRHTMALLLITMVIFTGQVFLVSSEKDSWQMAAKSAALIDLNIKYTTDIAVADDGSVFVLDSGNGRVTKFDSKLKKVTTFGKRGEGPGEFARAYSMGIDSKKTLYLVDSHKKIIAYNQDGRYLREIRLPVQCMIIRGYVLDYPYCIGTKMNIKAIEPGYTVVLFNLKEQKVIKEYDLIHQPNYGIRTSTGGVIAPTVKYLGGQSWIEAKNGLCLMGEGQRRNVRLVDQTGQFKARIKSDIAITPLKSPEADYLVNLLYDTWPSNFAKSKIRSVIEKYKGKNPIHAIKLDNDCFYVFPVPEDITRDDTYPAEIYNLTGGQIGTVYFPRVPKIIHNQYAYWIENDEEEDNRYLVKYKIPKF